MRLGNGPESNGHGGSIAGRPTNRAGGKSRAGGELVAQRVRRTQRADKGYHSRDGLKVLHDSPWKTRISEPTSPTGKGGILRWHGDDQARTAVYANRRRLLSGVAKAADRGGMRRTWLRGRDNVQKRYLIHIAGYNLGLIMRLLTGSGTPRRWAGSNLTAFWLWMPVDSAHHAICLAILTDDNPLQPTSACIVIGIAER
jgi:hypothetical protein